MINKLCTYISGFAKDKILHFLVGYIVLDFCLSLGQQFNFGVILNSILSYAIVSVLIISKEFLDKKQSNSFNWCDILVGYLGVIVKFIIFIIQVV